MNINPYLTAALLGTGTHILYFHWGEKYLYPWQYVQVYTAGWLITLVTKLKFSNASTLEAFIFTSTVVTAILAGLYGSLVTYRLFFNPLNSIPGPYWARLSKFDLSFRQRRERKLHKYLHASHQSYGPFLHIGPSDVSITHPDAVQAIYGSQSSCTKSEFYGINLPRQSLHMTRDPAFHARRRRVWSPAFSEKALRGYENRVQTYLNSFIAAIDKHNGQPMNMSKWFNFYTFDIMGDLSFGQSFDMLESEEKHWILDVMSAGFRVVAFAFPGWFLRALTTIPRKMRAAGPKNQFFEERLKSRMSIQGKSENPDIMHFLIEEYENANTEQKVRLMQILPLDCRLIIVAGSDTTATTLTHLFYHLASKPDILQKLRHEMAKMLDKGAGELNNQKLQHARYLNGCIDETLRLNPPIGSGVPRVTPQEGLVIAGTYIPGGTNVQTPYYAMGHDETLFERAEEFVPERFFSHPELIKHKDAWGPFSIGPYNCIGKNLAYMEIRVLTAALVMRYDVSLAPGEDGSNLINNTKDQFTLLLAPFNLVFAKRQGPG